MRKDGKVREMMGKFEKGWESMRNLWNRFLNWLTDILCPDTSCPADIICVGSHMTGTFEIVTFDREEVSK